jgi:hypothetical protein
MSSPFSTRTRRAFYARVGASTGGTSRAADASRSAMTEQGRPDDDLLPNEISERIETLSAQMAELAKEPRWARRESRPSHPRLRDIDRTSDVLDLRQRAQRSATCFAWKAAR